MKLIKKNRINKTILSHFRSAWNGLLPMPEVHTINIFYKKNVRFAQSSIRTSKKGNEITSWRNLMRNSMKSWDATSVTIRYRKWIKTYEKNLLRAEDPRLFLFAEEAYVMVQTFDEEKLDIYITVENLDKKILYNLKSPLGFNGKNWVPLEYKGELYFVYSLSPLVVQKFNPETSSLELINSVVNFDPKWEHDLEHSIGLVRGGSPGIHFPEIGKVVGFSHAINATGDIHAHRMGVWSLDMTSYDFKHFYLTNYSQGFLIDPYGIQVRGDKIIVDGSMAQEDIHLANSPILNFRFEFDKKNVFDLLMIERLAD